MNYEGTRLLHGTKNIINQTHIEKIVIELKDEFFQEVVMQRNF